MKTVETIKGILSEHPDHCGFSAPVDDSLVEMAEERLDVKLPNSYKEFLRTWGVMWFNGREYYGLISEESMTRGIPDMVWFNTHIRKKYDFPSHLLVFLEEEDRFYCFDTSKMDETRECPIVHWDKISNEMNNEFDMNFLEFLLDDLEETLEL